MKRVFPLWLFCAMVVAGFLQGGEVRSWHFVFGTDPVAGARSVRPGVPYSKEQGFGFEPGAEPAVQSGEFVTSARPFLFSADVPEGNYRVVVELGDDHATSQTTIKAEARRLMVENLSTAAGVVVTREFIVNVRTPQLPPPPQNAPGGTEVRLNDREQGHFNWDHKLTLEFNGPAPKVRSVRIESVTLPTVYLAGDSTVTDQRWEPGASWGQMLPRFLQPGVAVANHAESGETLKSFLTAYRLDKILSQLKPGDYVFLQFGHNDSKTQWPQTYVEAVTTYRAYLRTYIAEVRRRGATPVLITSVQRRSFDASGRITNTHGHYPAAMKGVAAEESVALIDLHAMSTVFYEALGPEKAPLAFSADGKDTTHHNNYGAYELARCVIEGIRAAKLRLAKSIADDAGVFDPAKPDAVESFALPASLQRSDLTPRGN